MEAQEAGRRQSSLLYLGMAPSLHCTMRGGNSQGVYYGDQVNPCVACRRRPCRPLTFVVKGSKHCMHCCMHCLPVMFCVCSRLCCCRHGKIKFIYGPTDASATHYILLQKIQTGFITFLILPSWYWLTQFVPDTVQGQIKWWWWWW